VPEENLDHAHVGAARQKMRKLLPLVQAIKVSAQ
jgi:hypothetical protein